MPRPRRVEPFHLVVTDRDKNLFNVVGPMTDDTNWNNRVCKAQDQGRQVNCHTPDRSLSRDQIVAEVRKSLGLTYTDESLV